jgi:hypothetical protein
MSTEIITNVHHVDAANLVTFDFDGESMEMKYREWLRFINFCYKVDSHMKITLCQY